MRHEKHQLLESFPFTSSHLRSTLHFTQPPTPGTTEALRELIGQGRQTKRVSAALPASDAALFVKTQPLTDFKSRCRVTWGYPKRDGMFDWPVEELINSFEAWRRGAPVPSLLGFGYRKTLFGITEEFFIISQLLENHVDALAWLLDQPDRIESLISSAFALMLSLHHKRITHMDLWAANIMLSNADTTQATAIDLENCFFEQSRYPSETLGFQFGFFYYRQIYRFITESRYDALVYQALQSFPALDQAKFAEFYTACKHEKVGRKERRKIFLHGQLIIG
jgi:hypothetical protein